MENHFALFGMTPRFTIDAAVLDAAYRDLQGRVHPDKFAAASDAEKRVAMQWATRANEAYQTLKSPLKRAAYLCELNGVDLAIESNTQMPPAFLMQQMAWRESLEEADTAQALETLLEDTSSTHNAALADLALLLDVQHDPVAAAQVVRRLMFVERFAHEVEGRLDRISA